MARARKRPDDAPGVVAGRRAVLELLRTRSGVQRVLLARGAAIKGPLTEIEKLAHEAGVPLLVVERAEVERLARGLNHQGVAAVTARYRYAPLERLLRPDGARLLFLDGVMDPHNLGSLLRSADGAGFHGVVIPARRAAGVNATVRRVSAGAAEVVPVACVTNLGRALEQARRAGVWIVGLDADAPDDLWRSHMLEPPIGLVCGSEDRGLSRTVRSGCDALVRIPLGGSLESVNVSVAGAIAMFEVARRLDLDTSRD